MDYQCFLDLILNQQVKARLVLQEAERIGLKELAGSGIEEKAERARLASEAKQEEDPLVIGLVLHLEPRLASRLAAERARAKREDQGMVVEAEVIAAEEAQVDMAGEVDPLVEETGLIGAVVVAVASIDNQIRVK